jgi:hypothetical protein
VPTIRPVPYQTLVRTFEKDGFTFARQSGDHLIYTKPDVKRVRAFNQDGSPGSERFTVSTNGGIEPTWPKRGNEIFYVGAADMLMTVDVQSAPVFKAGVPRELFKMRRTGVVGYDAAADGQKFLVSTPVDEASSAPATVVLNWFDALRRLVPSN